VPYGLRTGPIRRRRCRRNTMHNGTSTARMAATAMPAMRPVPTPCFPATWPATREGEGEGGDAGGESDEIAMGAVWIASTATPTTPTALRAVCNALGLENMPVESASTLLAACAAGMATVAVMMTEPGLMSRLTAVVAMAASLAMAVLIPSCVAWS